MDYQTLTTIVRSSFSFIPLFAAAYSLVVLIMVGIYIWFKATEKKINRVGLAELVAIGYGAWALMIFWMYYAARLKW